jgi:hypothetical protein
MFGRRGEYPAISVDFKNIKANSYDDILNEVRTSY